MDYSNGEISKIAKIAYQFNEKKLKGTGLGPSENKLVHVVKHNPGVSQKRLSDLLELDKAAVARMIANLEKKKYLRHEQDINDKRSKKIYVAEELSDFRHSNQADFYKWLFDDIPENELEIFLKVLHKLNHKCCMEQKNDFANIIKCENE